ncbi:MAG: MarR family winged helix-turn-helix transcriptional regulator [Jiangellaceae bacterium]
MRHSGIGTRLRAVLDAVDAGIETFYAERGVEGVVRPRYVPVLRALAAEPPPTITEIADAIGVTHSAASQTVDRMRSDGLVELRRGPDARTRVVQLLDRGRHLMPVVNEEWECTDAATGLLSKELPCSIEAFVGALEAALERRSMAERIRDAAITPWP